jgi:hypothetical protein
MYVQAKAGMLIRWYRLLSLKQYRLTIVDKGGNEGIYYLAYHFSGRYVSLFCEIRFYLLIITCVNLKKILIINDFMLFSL